MAAITSGSIPATLTGQLGTGVFTTDYNGNGLLVAQYSLDGIAWDTGSVLGSAVTISGTPQFGGFQAFEVSIEPTVEGAATLFLRVLVDGEFGPSFETSVTAYSSDGEGFIVEFLYDGKSIRPGHVVALADGGAICALDVSAGSGETAARVLSISTPTGVQPVATKPAGQVARYSLVRLNWRGEAQWVRWLRSDGLFGLARTGPNGVVVGVARSSSGGTTTLYGSDWEVAQQWPVPATSDILLFTIDATTGASSNSTVIATAGAAIVTADQLASNETRVAVAFNIGAAAGSVTFGGTTATFGDSASGARAAVVSLDSSLVGLWSVVWTRGQLANTSGDGVMALRADGEVFVATRATTGTPSVHGLGISGSNSRGIAKITSIGTVAWHREGVRDQLLSATTGDVVVMAYSDGPTTVSFGGVSQSIIDDATLLWGINAVTGFVQWGAASGPSDGPTSAGAAVGDYAALVISKRQAARSAVLLVNGVDGSIAWEASTGSATAIAGQPGGVHEAQLGPNGSTIASVYAAYGSSVVVDFTSSDGTVESRATSALGSWSGNVSAGFVASISPEGIWGRGAGGGLPSGQLAPPYGEWPVSTLEDEVLSATVFGYDPDGTGSAATLEWWDGMSGTWSTVPEEGIDYLGGHLAVIQGTLEGGAMVSYLPPANFYGDRAFAFRWVVNDEEVGGIVRTSAARLFRTEWVNVPEAPDAPTGEMPTVPEDTTSIGTWSFGDDPDNVGEYTWSLSPQTSKPSNWDALYPPAQHPDGQPDWHASTGSTVTVLDGGVPVGTATIVSQDDAARNALMAFIPYPNVAGTFSWDCSVIGSLRSGWVTASVTVESAGDAPSALLGTAPDIDEDSAAEFVLSWSDPDVDPSEGAAGFIVQLGLVELVDDQWQVTSWTDADDLDIGNAVIRVLDYSESTLEALLRVEGAANQHGEYRFAGRVYEDGAVRVYGPGRVFTATIGSVPDTPARVQGSMPVARWGTSVQGAFSTEDPDSDSQWTFEIAASADGAYGSSLALDGGVNLTVVDVDPDDRAAGVRLDQQPPGAAVNRYQFWITATDSHGFRSEPALIRGFIGPPAANVWLQRLDRTETDASVQLVVPLRNVTSLSVTESLDGSGAADLTVSAAEVRRRAEALGIGVHQLLDAGSVELLVAVAGAPAFVGPLTDVEWEVGAAEVALSARGLLSYLETRVLGTDVEFVNADLASIAAALVEGAQAAAFGNLGIDDATSMAGQNGTLRFPAGMTVADALGKVGEQVGAPEIWIDASRQLRAAATRGMDRRSRVRLSSGMAEVARWASRSEAVVTVARVVGGDDGTGGTFVGAFEDPASMETYGRVERVYSAPQLLSAADCAALAERIVRASCVAADTVTLETVVAPTRPFNVNDLGVGDVITVDLRDPQAGQILGAYRIVNRTVRLVDEAVSAYGVSLDLEPARYVDGRLSGSRSRHNARVFTQLAAVEMRMRQPI